MTNSQIENEQKDFCKKKGYDCLPTTTNSKLGFAIETVGLVPINGLRHPPQGDTNGWYIWCGEELSSEPSFFSPLHTQHLEERCPEVLKLLGLPPGFRFLIAGDYIDIWYDPSLLDV